MLWDGWVALGYVRRGRVARGMLGVAAARWRRLGCIGEGHERLSDLGAWRGCGWGPLRGSVCAGALWHGGCASRRDGARQRGGRGASAHVRRCGAGREHVRERRGASGPGGACVTRSRWHGARLVWWPTEGHISGVMGVTCCRWCSRRRGLGWLGGMAGKGAVSGEGRGARREGSPMCGGTGARRGMACHVGPHRGVWAGTHMGRRFGVQRAGVRRNMAGAHERGAMAHGCMGKGVQHVGTAGMCRSGVQDASGNVGLAWGHARHVYSHVLRHWGCSSGLLGVVDALGASL